MVQLSFDTRNESLQRFKNFKSLGAAIVTFVNMYGHQPVHVINVAPYVWDLGPVPKNEAWDHSATEGEKNAEEN